MVVKPMKKQRMHEITTSNCGDLLINLQRLMDAILLEIDCQVRLNAFVLSDEKLVIYLFSQDFVEIIRIETIRANTNCSTVGIDK